MPELETEAGERVCIDAVGTTLFPFFTAFRFTTFLCFLCELWAIRQWGEDGDDVS